MLPPSDDALRRLKRQEYAHHRRALALGCEAERFDPLQLFERDKWTCDICKRPIDPNLTFPDPGAPSIEHDPALACGGRHTLDGAHAAHRGCNITKGQTVDGPRAAKIKRVQGKTGQIAKRNRAKDRGTYHAIPSPKNPWGSQKRTIPSRPFPKRSK